MSRTVPPEVGAILRRIPSVDEVLAGAAIQRLLEREPRWAVLEAVREVLAACRERALAGGARPEAATALLDLQTIQASVAKATARKAGPSLRPVINASGVLLHTNLGRAPLAPSALAAIAAAARGYSNLEFDLDAGIRGSRQAHVERLLCALTGAEAALVVNNNAAAVLLGVNTLAEGREVVISRSELVEIGDAFRIPDVMTRAGGRLREVGTTNRTHLADYERAIGPETGLILKVHRSNFQILGFTADVEMASLVTLARQRGLPVMEDLGSGALVDLSIFGLRREPLAADAILGNHRATGTATGSEMEMRLQGTRSLQTQGGCPSFVVDAIMRGTLDGDFLDLAIEQLSQRVQSPFDITAEDAQVVIDEIAPYWKGKTYHEALAVALPEETARYTFDPKDPLMSRFIVNETSSFRSSLQWVHDYEKVLKKGFRGIRKEAKERLNALVQANKELVRNLAHEIKNPLGGIRGAAQLLAMEIHSPELTEYTHVIVHEADRLQALVDRLLAPHRRPHVVGDVNIHEICERVRTLMLAEFPRGLRFARDYDASIPEFRGDREQLIQAVLNIVHNATQALGERIAAGDARIILRTRVARQATIARTRYRLALDLHIIDNGPGIPDELKDRVFFPLVSGRDTGSGLGLTLAQTFVQQHNGLIEVDSRPGRTDFRILIPLQPAHDT